MNNAAMTGTKDNDQLKLLQEKRKKLSREIGARKSDNQSVNHLIKQVKNLTEQIKSLQKKLESISQKKTPAKTENMVPQLLPSQFNPRPSLPTNDDNDTHLCKQNTPEEWNKYIDGHPNATIYHHYHMKTLVEETFGHKCYFWSLKKANNTICAILPMVEMKSRLFGHFFISIPFFNYGGILADNQNYASQIQNEAAHQISKSDAEYIEFRDCFPNPLLPVKTEKVAMLLPLAQDTDLQWKLFGSKLRAQINKANKNSSLSIKQGKEDLLVDFYKVFSRNMRDLGTPVYTPKLFRNMLQYFNSASITVVYLGEKPVAAGFTLGWRDTLEIPWASTIKEANKYDVNMVMYSEILLQAIRDGYKIFDFGRSSENSNTYRFKKQWGAKAHKLYWHYLLNGSTKLPQLNNKNPKYQMVIAAWKKLPLAVTNRIGPLIVKWIP